MKKKNAFYLLLIASLLGSCNSLREISEEEALMKLESFGKSLLLEKTPSKYTVKTTCKNPLKYGDKTIDNALATLLLDEEKSFYQVHLEGENNGTRFFSELYLVTRNDTELWELRWESGEGDKQTKTRREIKGKTFQDYLQNAINEKESRYHDSPKEIIDTINTLKETSDVSFKGTYKSQNEDDLYVTFSYEVEGESTEASYSFVDHKLDSTETSEETTKIFWDECDAIAPQFKDYSLIQ